MVVDAVNPITAQTARLRFATLITVFVRYASMIDTAQNLQKATDARLTRDNRRLLEELQMLGDKIDNLVRATAKQR